MSSKDITPCYGCERRSATCHSSCEDYKTYQQANRERSELISRKRDEESMVYEVKVRGIRKIEKKKANVKYWKG